MPVTVEHDIANKLGKLVNRMLFFTYAQKQDVLGFKVNEQCIDTISMVALTITPNTTKLCASCSYSDFMSIFNEEDIESDQKGFIILHLNGAIAWYQEDIFKQLFVIKDYPLTGKEVARATVAYFIDDVKETETNTLINSLC